MRWSPVIAGRVHAADTLKRETLDMAIPAVSVVHPKRGVPVEEVMLPGNAQAYVATPVWARTSGYLKAWYFDIGAHVKAGQLLAEIETPEVDKDLDQARADLATAVANYETLPEPPPIGTRLCSRAIPSPGRIWRTGSAI